MPAKTSSFIFLLLLILLLFPFFLLSFYIHPSADDYGFTHLIKAWGSWGYQHFMYNNWQGRYFANFLFSFNPLTFDSFIGYKIFALVLLTTFALSVFYLIFVLFKDQVKKTQLLIVALLLMLLYLNIIPSPSETIYWITGSIEYFIPAILTLIFLPIVVQGMRRKEHYPAKLAIAALLGFCICGCNEIYIIFLLEFLALIILLNVSDRHVLKFILPVFAVIVFSSLFALMAPGNYMRMTNFSRAHHFLYAFEESIISEAKLFIIHFKSPAFIIISILSLPVLSALKNKGNKPFIKINPWLASMLFIFIFFTFFFPVSYSTGLPSPLRIYNTTSALFILSWFFLLYLFIFYYNVNFQIPKPFQTFMLIAAIIFFITGFNKVPGKEIYFTGNVSRAAYELAFEARTYNDELNSRYAFIANEKAKGNQHITIPSLSVKPASICFIDILPDSSSWINIGTAQYFGINSIKIK